MISAQNSTFTAPWIVCALGFNREYIALGSFMEHPTNEIYLLGIQDLTLQATIRTRLPSTRLRWISEKVVVSAANQLHFYELTERGVVKDLMSLQHPKSSKYHGPHLTFDIHEETLLSCSADTTITQWDVAIGRPVVQIKAHDAEVNDIRFGHNHNIVTTASLDGCCKLFDLRDPRQHSLLYQRKGQLEPLFRVASDQLEGVYTVIAPLNSDKIYLYDVRAPLEPVQNLRGHCDQVTQIAFHPYKTKILCSAAADGRMLMWNVGEPSRHTSSMEIADEINDFQWDGEWMALSYHTFIELLQL